jgi:uncharacterized protein
LLDGATAPQFADLARLYEAVSAAPALTPSFSRELPSPPFLGLVPTRGCNLNCVYCGFGSRQADGRSMSADLAVAAVDWMAERVRELGQDVLEVHFFGGEPFCAPEVVDVAVHRSRAVAALRGLTTRFEVATNGILSRAQTRFVGDYFDTVVLSLDGPREMHDRHRPARSGAGSFETASRVAGDLSRSSTELCLRVCVTRDSVCQLEEIARTFCDAFQPSAINFETLKPTPESDAAGLAPPDPYDFSRHFFRASRVAHARGTKPVYAAASVDTPRFTFCPVGQDTLIVSPDGRVSSCYLLREEWQARGLDLDVGRCDVLDGMQLDADALVRLRRLVSEKPRCGRCFCRWTCAGGCHVNHSRPGCGWDYDDFCVQTRIVTGALLLTEIGWEALASRLTESHSAMADLALRPSDSICDWEASP